MKFVFKVFEPTLGQCSCEILGYVVFCGISCIVAHWLEGEGNTSLILVKQS